jgi:threonine synthase
VWAKREWVLPGATEADAVTLGEGWNALTPAPALAKALGIGSLHVKQCGVSQTGSFKDLGMSVLVSQVRRMRAAGQPIRAVVCASTGDTSAALAAYGAAAGIPTCVLLPASKVTTAQLVQPLAHGATVVALETDFDGCMAIVRELAADPTLYLANSMNPWRLEGQKTVAVEIVQQLGWVAPDWIALPGGNLGNTAAVGQGLALVEAHAGVARHTRILVGQVERANPLWRSFQSQFRDRPVMEAGETAATAIRIGAPVSYERAIRQLVRCGGLVTQATEDALAEAAALADRHGQYLCPQTAAALAGVAAAAREGKIGRDASVVLVSTAHGLKFTEFKVRYHEGTLADATCAGRNAPVRVAADLASVRAALAKVFP